LTTPETADSTDAKRLIWRCRRGMLELDIVLGKFISQHFDALTRQQLRLLEVLLDYQDTELLELVTGRAQVEDPSIVELLTLIRSEYDDIAFGRAIAQTSNNP